MNTIEIGPCRICKTTEHLRPKWNSDDGVGWVHCDECGSVSSAVCLSQGRTAIIEQWNKENPADGTKGATK